jgi:hypothetical protein
MVPLGWTLAREPEEPSERDLSWVAQTALAKRQLRPEYRRSGGWRPAEYCQGRGVSLMAVSAAKVLEDPCQSEYAVSAAYAVSSLR